MQNRPLSARTSPKSALADRLVQVRRERYGEQGIPELSAAVGLPARTWSNYEAGVTIPGEFLLAFIEATGVEPRWLISGMGPAYRVED